MSKHIKLTPDQWEGLQSELSFLKSQVAELRALAGLKDTDFLDGLTLEKEEPKPYDYRDHAYGSGSITDKGDYGFPINSTNDTNLYKHPDGSLRTDDGSIFSIHVSGEESGKGLWQKAKDFVAGEETPRPSSRTIQDIVETLGEPVTTWDEENWGLDESWDQREPQLVEYPSGPPGLTFGPFVVLTPEERDAILESLVSQEATVKSLEQRLEREERVQKHVTTIRDAQDRLRQQGRSIGDDERERLIIERPLPENRSPIDPDGSKTAYASAWEKLSQTGEE